MWYLTRGSGAVSLVLLTGSLVLGIVDARRWKAPGWPRFVVDGVHRNLSLLAVVFVVVHVVTTVLDGFAPIGLLDAVVPFVTPYRPVWIGLGAISFDLLLALVVTSLLRARLGWGAWRTVHWLAYASWPLALVHGLASGSDTNSAWMQIVTVACIAAASILAKVTRDAIMTDLHDRWPQYDFAKHKGYVTSSHAKALIEWGPCAEHRRRYVNVRRAMQGGDLMGDNVLDEVGVDIA